MKRTLLDLTQSIMASMGSDEINSINDTVESQQVAETIKTVYFDIIYRAALPEHFTISSLDSPTDNNTPTLMRVPSDVAKVISVRYDARDHGDTQPNIIEMQYLPLEEFLNYTYQFPSDGPEVGHFNLTQGLDVITFYYYNDRHPTYYTSFDDYTVIFDAYNAAVETTLQKAKTTCVTRKIIPFSLVDTFIPDLDAEQFPLLLNEAKALCWMELKQAQHPIAERNSRRAWVHLQKSKNIVDNLADFNKLQDFGRK